jgi:hypothetical protein
MKKIVLMIMTALMISAVANANTTDRNKKRKKHKTHKSSHHGWKNVSIGRTCNKKKRH